MSVGKYSLSVLVQCIVVVCLYGQQTPQISHYMFNTQMYNPASAGFTNSIVASGIHRQQWYGMEGAPQTTLISFDAPLSMIRSGVGLNIANDQIGMFNNTTIQLSYNYQIPFLDGMLGMGLQGGMNSMGLKFANANPREQGDPVLREREADESQFSFDVGIGFFYSVADQYEIGISLTPINNPSFQKGTENRSSDWHKDHGRTYRQKQTLNLFGNYNFSLDAFPRIDFVPSILIKSDFTTMQVDLSLIGLFDKHFWGGITYRPGDAVVLLGGLNLKQFPLQVGVAYDIATNWMSRASKIGGGFEVFARYSFNLSVDRLPQSYKNSRFL